MKFLRFRVCIQVVLLTTTVTLSQVLAEESPQQKVNNDTQDNGGNSYVGQGILQVLPKSGGAVKAAFPSDPGKTDEKVTSPGRTGTLTAILIAAGGAAALSFLLTRGGDKHAPPGPVTTPPAPVTTSVTAGTPVISAPPGH